MNKREHEGFIIATSLLAENALHQWLHWLDPVYSIRQIISGVSWNHLLDFVHVVISPQFLTLLNTSEPLQVAIHKIIYAAIVILCCNWPNVERYVWFQKLMQNQIPPPKMMVVKGGVPVATQVALVAPIEKRGCTHSLLGTLILTLFVTTITMSLFYFLTGHGFVFPAWFEFDIMLAGAALLITWGLHIVADIFTENGVRLFWPNSAWFGGWLGKNDAFLVSLFVWLLFALVSALFVSGVIGI